MMQQEIIFIFLRFFLTDFMYFKRIKTSGKSFSHKMVRRGTLKVKHINEEKELSLSELLFFLNYENLFLMSALYSGHI